MEKYQFSDMERAVLEKLPSPLAVYQFVDRHIFVLALSDGYRKMFGFDDITEAYRILDQDVFYNVHPDDVARMSEAARRFISADVPYEVIFRARKHGEQDYRIAHGRGDHIFTQTGVRLAYVWFTDEGTYTGDRNTQAIALNQVFNDALHEESILKASYFDNLTGLPNMTHFFALAETGEAKLREQGKKATLLYLDLNGMKYYNEKFGFAEGDKLLQALAKLLALSFGNENCCHISGDRFAVYTEEDGLVTRLGQFFLEARELNDVNSLPVRIGIYPTGNEDVPLSSAFDRAKMACDAIPKSDISCFNFYSNEMRRDVQRRQYILSHIDRAIEEKWIKVYYQPIVRAVDEKICDEEALARWIDPVEGFLSPADFIPTLEDARLIYKLDLYMLEQVLEKMNYQAAIGLTVVPHSINLSRSDFDACDIVEEIRKRVDASGIGRDKITIEITESIIGSSIDFMKTQVERFRDLGFPVWMDDFGSGYSSLDVLQSIRFDLLKFDMSFMRKLDEGDSGKIILTELMKMATSLGVDTVCEGVETESQVRFLQDIGCSKLQGFYYSKPVPFETTLEDTISGLRIGYENPDEASYYEAIGRVNLFDLDVLANLEDDGAIQNTFNTLPMGILEVRRNHAQYIRSNQSYREFVKDFFGFDATNDVIDLNIPTSASSSMFLKTVKQCCDSGNRSFFDEKMPDGIVVHQFIKRIGVNPVTGDTAVAVAVLSISKPSEGATYADIARALAADYYNIYVVDLDTERFIEYSTVADGEDMAMERRGEDFFEAARRDTMTRIYEEDRESFLASFSKQKIIQALDTQGVYNTTYRLIDTGTPMYASLKITRMHPNGRRIIMGVSIIEAQIRQKEAEERAHQRSIVFGRIAALFGKQYALYTVDPETGRYSEYNVTSGYDDLGFDKKGEDFFTKGRNDGEKMAHPEDLPYFLEHFTRENILRNIREKGLFQMNYRLVINGEPKPIVLKAAMVEESDGEKLTVGVNVEEE
ncbi:MAG: EAL domain-containing protein [Eggerthellaceae bacterium]|nr:EAL domain-containing protein [Eggerthellaceae bacterium]